MTTEHDLMGKVFVMNSASLPCHRCATAGRLCTLRTWTKLLEGRPCIWKLRTTFDELESIQGHLTPRCITLHLVQHRVHDMEATMF